MNNSPSTPPSPLASVWARLQADPHDAAARANWQELQAAGAPEAVTCCQAFDVEAYAALTRVAVAGAELDRGLRPLAEAQVAHRHGLANAAVEVSGPAVAALAADPLLRQLLARDFCTSLPLERHLTRVRAWLLAEFGSTRLVTAELRPLVVALALQGFNNEYVLPVSADEERTLADMLAGLGSALQRGDITAAESALLLAAMYQPCGAMPAAEQIGRRTWAADVEPLLTRTLREPAAERALAAEIPALGEVADPVARSVRAQYEASPYPRWLNFRRPPRGVPERLGKLRPNLPAAAPPGQILVAGCGTGKHSVSVALGNPGAAVLAVDLSFASLGYAARMAGACGAANIRHLQGDLRDLPKLGRQFDHVECCGVLHHIRDHAAAWGVLDQCLRPGGTARIAVYSRVARLLVSHVRAAIAREGLGNSPDEVRRFRARLLTEPGWQGLLPLLVRMNDFFTLSMTRDLLFHVQEHQYSVEEIERIATGLGWELLAVDLPSRLRTALRPDHPCKSAAITTFAQWRQAEPAYVGSMTMFDFWLRKRSS